jgi:hypothetical protein
MTTVLDKRTPNGVVPNATPKDDDNLFTSITQKCVITHVRVETWHGILDSQEGDDAVRAAHRNAKGTSQVKKRLVRKERLERGEAIARQIRAFHREITWPWLDNNGRICDAAVGLPKLTKGIRDLQDQLEEWLDNELVPNYPAIVQEGLADLNGLGNIADYPSPSEIKAQYRVYPPVPLPVPIANDVRVKLANEDIEVMRAQVESTIRAMVAAGVQETARKIIAVVAKMSATLKNYEGHQKGRFNDTLVDNVREVVDNLETLNILDDPVLTQARKDMLKELCRFDAKELRKDEKARQDVAAEADKILKSMEAYF